VVRNALMIEGSMAEVGSVGHVGKSISVQARTGPEGSRSLSLADV
jgi:hypothetical protein